MSTPKVKPKLANNKAMALLCTWALPKPLCIPIWSSMRKTILIPRALSGLNTSCLMVV